MPITFAKPPDESDQTVRAGINEVLQLHPTTRMSSGIGGSPETTNTSQAHQVYSVRLDDLRDGRGMASAQLEGWRYLIRTPSTLHSAEVGLGGSGNATEFRGLNTGPMNEAMETVLQSVETDPNIENGNFECRLFRANALNLAALWFRNQSGEEDYVAPLPPAPAGFSAGKLYRREEFEELLTAAARNKRDLEAESASGATA